MEGRTVYSTTTLVAKDEYTREYENRIHLQSNSMCRLIKVGVSPVQRRVTRTKYKDANWMV